MTAHFVKRKGNGFPEGKKKKANTSNRECSVLYVNVNGFSSKKDSIKQLMQEHSPDIVLLIETKVCTKVSIKIDGYQVFPVVTKKGSGGGLPVAVKHGLCSSLVIDYGENAEFITVRLCFGLESIRLILSDGPQKGDAEDEIEDFYENLQIQLDRGFLKGDSVLLVGDLNAELGKPVINHDIHDMSANGKLSCDIIDKCNLYVVNALGLCKGVFTRVNNKNSAEKSVLDYVIVSSNLSDNIVSMTIDEGKLLPLGVTFKGAGDLLIIM